MSRTPLTDKAFRMIHQTRSLERDVGALRSISDPDGPVGQALVNVRTMQPNLIVMSPETFHEIRHEAFAFSDVSTRHDDGKLEVFGTPVALRDDMPLGAMAVAEVFYL